MYINHQTISDVINLVALLKTLVRISAVGLTVNCISNLKRKTINRYLDLLFELLINVVKKSCCELFHVLLSKLNDHIIYSPF